MRYTEADEGLENEVARTAECCGSPKIEFHDWSWDKSNGCWRFDGICYNCWELSHGKIHAVEVEFDN